MSDRLLLGRRRFVVAGLGAVLAACAGQTNGPSAAGTAGSSPTPGPSPTDASPTGDGDPVAAPSPSPADDVAATPSGDRDLPTGIVPASVAIPAIGVEAPCVLLNLTADEVEVPEDFDDTGWWVQTRRPGEVGPAVIGGHVDSTRGPAVFHRLRELRPGDQVIVSDADGQTRTFVVDRDPIQVDKHERPPEVFGFGDARPELRLITCGGDFDPSIGHYTDNIVVFCHDPSFDA